MEPSRTVTAELLFMQAMESMEAVSPKTEGVGTKGGVK